MKNLNYFTKKLENSFPKIKKEFMYNNNDWSLDRNKISDENFYEKLLNDISSLETSIEYFYPIMLNTCNSFYYRIVCSNFDFFIYNLKNEDRNQFFKNNYINLPLLKKDILEGQGWVNLYNSLPDEVKLLLEIGE